jgi:hypothetical protein
MNSNDLLETNHLDSMEELYFLWYLEELKKNGYLDFEHGQSISLNPNNLESLRLQYDRQTTTPKQKKIKIESKLHKYLELNRHYTPDFTIQWQPKAEGIFFCRENTKLTKKQEIHFIADESLVSIIDVKPTFQNPNHSYNFSEKQAFVYFMTGIFVQKIVPLGKAGMFAKTFTPNRYLFTDKSMAIRKINHKVRTLLEYEAAN